MVRKSNKLREARPPYVCPYCFTQVDMDHLHYTCGQACAKAFANEVFSTRNTALMKYVTKDGTNEVDPEKSLFYERDPQGPHQVIAKYHIIRDSSGLCDVCNRPVYRRMCPVCHHEIPPGVEEEGNRIFVILGPKGVGKSHYIAVLINQLKNIVSSEFKAVLSPADDSTTLKYRDRYYHRLYEENMKLPSTKSLEISDEAREPLIYYFRVFEGDKPKMYTLVFFDTAGEDLVSAEKMETVRMNNFIASSSGIVYLVDPLQIKYVNSRIHLEKKPPVGPDVSDVLSNIIRIIRMNKKAKGRDRIEIPLAVCLTKCDVLIKSPENDEEAKVLFPLGSSVHIPREHGVFDKENFDQIDAELEEYLRRAVGENFIQTVDVFKQHNYFAVSALGCNPTQNTLPRGVSPMRVEDPIIWLLNTEEQK